MIGVTLIRASRVDVVLLVVHVVGSLLAVLISALARRRPSCLTVTIEALPYYDQQ